MANMTDAQRKAYEAALGRMQEAEKAPTQRLRTIAQGLTFGGADEAEAWLVSKATGRPYEDALAEVRGKLKAYQGARPWEALAYEAGGAALPAIAATLATGGTAAAPATARLFPMLGRLAAVGAAEGGAYAFGTGEGGFEERMERVPAGSAFGAGGSLLGAGIVAGGRKIISELVDIARRRLGGRGAKAVETELRRLAAETGKSIDEIADDVASGRILAENVTLKDVVRAYRAKGGPAATRLQEVLPQRSQLGRDKAMAEMQRYLAGTDENILMVARQTDEAARVAEKAAYAQFDDVEAGPALIASVKDALRRVPQAGDEIKTAYQAATGKTPFFSIKDGEVVFQRSPTVGEIERVRRAINNTASRYYREGQGEAGAAIADVERGLRSALNDVEGLEGVRADASIVRSARDAFKEGRKALAKSPEEIGVLFEDITAAGPEAVSSFRAGVMAAYKAKAATGQQKSLMRILADPNRKEGAILRIIFPADELDSVLDVIERAAGSQEAANYILQGSATAKTAEQVKRIGMDISAEDVSGIISGNPVAIANTASKAIKAMTPGLDDQQRLRVVNVLLSENPEFVRNALVDESGIAMLAEQVNRLVAAGGAGVQRAMRTQAGALGGGLLQ